MVLVPSLSAREIVLWFVFAIIAVIAESAEATAATSASGEYGRSGVGYGYGDLMRKRTLSLRPRRFGQSVGETTLVDAATRKT
jgi:hypothetical protein